MKGHIAVHRTAHKLLLVVLVIVTFLSACTMTPPPAPLPLPSPCLAILEMGDCVGISDGADNLSGDPQFDAVYRAIKVENDRVDALGPTVAIVYAMPLPRTPSQFSAELREELAGAHVMQLRANDPDSDLAGTTYVKILVANLGEAAAGFEPVVDRIKELAEPELPGSVVGVAGLGQSLLTVREAMAALAVARIPMIPTRLTADGISPTPGTDGVFRIAPPNSVQAEAAAGFLTESCRAALVQDIKLDDLYLQDVTNTFPILVAAAASRSGACVGGGDGTLPVARYDSSLGDVDNALLSRRAEICGRNPDTVYFGGRGADFPALVRVLGGRDQAVCPGPITVLTNDDGLALAAAIKEEIRTNSATTLQNALRSGITVIVTGLASPGAWGADPTSDSRLTALAGTCNRCLSTVLPRETTESGNVIMGHDAMLTFVTAIRASVTQEDQTVTAAKVLQALLGFGSTRPVAGASGPIGFDPQGRPIGKAVPILTIDERGTITYIESR